MVGFAEDLLASLFIHYLLPGLGTIDHSGVRVGFVHHCGFREWMSCKEV